VCPQIAGTNVTGDEDCLILNVFAPSAPPPQPLPVIVWIHGGGNHSGSSIRSTAAGGFDYDGQNKVEQWGILGTHHYRIGVLGFLAHPALDAESSSGSSGNYGVMDQIQALTWIHTNIAAFGGDPARVTVDGSSVGSTDIAALMVSPHVAGLFRGAILES